MSRQKIPLPIALLLLVTLACNSLVPTEAPIPTLLPVQTQGNSVLQSEDQVPRIDVREAKAAYDSGAAIFIDTRSVDAFAQKHITNALSIPVDKFETELANISLEQSQWIITYCT